jgi:tetratricopeptide (TPR) repeat protein
MALVARNLVAALLVGLLLAVSGPACAQSPAEAAALSEQVARLYEQGRYSDAIPLAERVVRIRETTLGANHPDVAQALNNLAILYQAQGLLANAEPLYKRALAINEKAFGANHHNVATSLNAHPDSAIQANLAELYQGTGPKFRSRNATEAVTGNK